MSQKNDLRSLKTKVQKFCEERDWDQFHGAKDLAIGIITEASELLEHFRFKSEKEVIVFFENKKKKTEISNELADVLFFIIRMAQRYDIDLGKAFESKLKEIGEKYPVSKSKGSNRKYNEL